MAEPLGPMPEPERPARPRRGGPVSTAAALVRRTLVKAWDDRIFGMAAEVGFWQLLCLAPLALIVLGVIGFIGGQLGPGRIAQIQHALQAAAGQVLVPQAAHDLVDPVVAQVLAHGNTEVASLGFRVALWSSSSAMADYVNTIVIAYDMRDVRSAVRTRALALVFSFAFIGVAIVLLPVLVVGPDTLASLLPQARPGRRWAPWCTWPTTRSSRRSCWP